MTTASLSPDPFPGLSGEIERIRRGYYTDQYFNLSRDLLAALSAEAAVFEGASPALQRQGLPELEIAAAEPGAMRVEMQFFARRAPDCLLAGMAPALYLLREATGVFEAGQGFVPTWKDLEVHAAPDGAPLRPWLPALRVRGRYRDFAHLETVLLGILTRATKVATRVHEALEAAGGKPVLFFPARFDLFWTQALDGYAYKTAVDAYNRRAGAHIVPAVSTDAQGEWWGGAGGGTVPHAFLLCFLRDTVESMVAFARLAPPHVPRIALVDVNNDCVGDSLAVAKALFDAHRRLIDDGRQDEALRYKLYAVRADTAGEMRDKSVPPLGDPRLDCGVNPRLIFELRRALDEASSRMDLPMAWHDRARRYFRQIKIVASGGFDADRIRAFERLGAPVDVYGVGSTFFQGPSNDFTADVVQVKVAGRWRPLAKEGRKALANPGLRPIDLSAI